MSYSHCADVHDILNDKEFTEEFKDATRAMTRAETMYGKVPEEHWSYPSPVGSTRRLLQRSARGCRVAV